MIGWHSDAADDPLNSYQPLAKRLSGLLLRLPDPPTSGENAEQLSDANNSIRYLSYGAIYNVTFDHRKKPLALADEAAKKFTTDIAMEPLSLGTTALDAILTFLKARKKNTDAILSQDTTKVANWLLDIATLLYATADEYDTRVQAQDLIAQQNYAKSDSGIHWSFDDRAEARGAPATPSPLDSTTRRTLNEAQSKLDLTLRQLRAVRWELFAEWWKCVSEYIKVGNIKERQLFYATTIKPLKDTIEKMAVLRDAVYF